MPIRRSRPMTFRARGVSDTLDATNVFAGAMASLSNLIPAPQTDGDWIARPASTLITAFSGFTTPAQGEALLSSGVRLYGMIQSARFTGKSEPFIYDTAASAFVTISGVTSANCPASTLNTGDWTPPTMAAIGAYVMVTHPGFNFSGGDAFGFFDMTGFSSDTVTGNTQTSTTIDSLSTDVLNIGWAVGMTITDSAGDIPAGTRIVAIASGGLSVTLSAAATGSHSGTTFTVAGGTFAAPLWCAGNLNLNPLPSRPVAVAQYAGSACFAVNTNTTGAVTFSDAGDPTQQTNITQTTTIQNGLPVTALAGLPLNTLEGGIIQSLIAFQGSAAIQQLTGAPTTSNLSVNSLNEATGTLAPNSIAQTPNGLLFMAPDGIRRINFAGVVSPAIGRLGRGITVPFLFAETPSRAAAAYQEGVYRISVVNGALPNAPTQDWWYHEDDDRWSGPHTFPAALISPIQEPINSFALFASGIDAMLWNSDPYQSLTAEFVENGAQMTFYWQTALLPDNQRAAMNALPETTIALAIPPQNSIQVSFTNEYGDVLNSVQLAGPPTPPTVWDAFTWGMANWGAGISTYAQQPVNWTSTITFKQGQLAMTGNCEGSLILGNAYMRFEELGFQILAGVA